MISLDTAIDIFHGITAIVAGASAIAAATPTPKDDSALAKVRKALEVVALMVGFARPKR